MRTFGEQLRDLRTARGWTGAKLASQSGCRQQQVSDWESGEESPIPKRPDGPDTLDELVQALRKGAPLTDEEESDLRDAAWRKRDPRTAAHFESQIRSLRAELERERAEHAAEVQRLRDQQNAQLTDERTGKRSPWESAIVLALRDVQITEGIGVIEALHRVVVEGFAFRPPVPDYLDPDSEGAAFLRGYRPSGPGPGIRLLRVLARLDRARFFELLGAADQLGQLIDPAAAMLPFGTPAASPPLAPRPAWSSAPDRPSRVADDEG